MKVRLRSAGNKDIEKISELFHATVLSVNMADYSQQETEDWAACGERRKHWEELMERFHFLIAETGEGENQGAFSAERTDDEKIVGFGAISEKGYLHAMFVHKNYQRCGIATLLLEALERYAGDKGIDKIWSEVSLTARRFFEQAGYVVVREQRKRAKYLELKNFVMEKKIARSE